MPRTAFILPLLLLTGCIASRPGPELTPEESALLAQLTRDPWVVVIELEREADGWITVLTRQGPQRVRYRLAPEIEGVKKLAIRRVRDEFLLE